MAAASYCVVLAAGQFAAAETVDTDQPSATSPQAAAATDNGVRALTTPIPEPVGDVVVDDAHQQVFISSTGANGIVVTDLDGQITRTIPGFDFPGEMLLSPDSSTLYVADGSRVTPGTITKIDTQTYETTPIAFPENVCPESLTYTGGQVWYWRAPCDWESSSDWRVGYLASDEEPTDVFATAHPPGHLRALPDRADRMVLAGRDGFISVYDVSSTPVLVAETPSAGSRVGCHDAALISGGRQVVTACAGLNVHEVFNTADLSTAPSIPSSEGPMAVAVTPDGRWVAAGVHGTHWPDIYLRDIQDGLPGAEGRRYDFPEMSYANPNSMAFSSTKRLFAVERTYEGEAVLHVIVNLAKTPTSLSVSLPQTFKYREKITGAIQMTSGPESGAQVLLTRRDRTGEHAVALYDVPADGKVTFTDVSGVTGPVTYVASYAGDDTHSPSGAKATTIVRPLPYDINADGYAETVVGVPGEDIGADKNTGMFHVLSGTASGATGSGSKSYHQDTAGVPGANESGDLLGYSNASGDFNGDGYADVAVSAGSENVGSSKDSGVVLIFYGSPAGLRTTGVVSLGAHHTHLGAGEEIYFGDALAAGDFNGDGRDDLAIGAAGASQVFVATGTPDGLSKESLTAYNKDTPGVPGDMHTDEWFGSALATGDVNGDGTSDLAIGAYLDYEDRGWSTGSVTMLYGGGAGLTGAGAQRWSKDSDGVQGAPATFNPDKNDSSDAFGWQVALADFNGDGKADLAAAAPGAPVTVSGVRKRDAGTVTVLYSDGSAISATGDAHVSQQTSGMPGTSGYEDHFGTTLAAGDANGDGRAELASYSPGDNYVTVVPGGASGLAYGSAKGWTQNSSGIPGSTETGDYWGNSLRFADIKGSGRMALIVGADGENSGKGAITVIYSTSSGLTGTGAKYFSQNSTGISGTAENGDAFGVFY